MRHADLVQVIPPRLLPCPPSKHQVPARLDPELHLKAELVQYREPRAQGLQSWHKLMSVAGKPRNNIPGRSVVSKAVIG